MGKLGITFSLVMIFFSDVAVAKKAPRISPLSILEEHTLPVAEVSGMAWRTDPKTKRRELIVVSDRESKLYVVDWAKRKSGLKIREFPLAEPGWKSEASEWESVFCDESGRVFVVREYPPEILVIAPDLKSIEGSISLRMPQGHELAEKWGNEENSNAEGLLPLRNGHFLVVKEKDPLRLLEFAPAGASAEGYRSDLSIEHSGIFPLPEKSKSFVPAFTWRFSEEMETLFEDSSGINLGPDGELYLLGDQKNLIASLGKKLKTKKDRVKLARLYSLPSRLKQAEGMVIDDEGRPIIATDRKKTNQANLFLLSPIR